MMNLDAIRAKLKGLEEGRTNTKKKWKPKESHVVRLLPLAGNEDLAFVIKWHYGVDNNRQMYCPQTHGDECPFCKLGEQLRSWKDENGKDKDEATRKLDWEFFKKIQAADKHYAPIALRKKDSQEIEGVYLWEMTPKSYQALLKICTNDERNADHPDGGALAILNSFQHGYDVNVTLKKAGQGGNNTTYDITEIEARISRTWLVKNDLVACQNLVKQIPTSEDIAKPISTREAEKIFAEWKARLSEGESGDSSTGSSGMDYTPSNNGEKPASGGLDVNDVVSKLEKLLPK